MDRIEEDRERAAQRAKQQQEDLKRRRFREVCQTFEKWVRRLVRLRTLVSVSENINAGLFEYTLIIDQDALQHLNPLVSAKREQMCEEALKEIDQALRGAVKRWDILRPLSFVVADKSGGRSIGWKIDQAGTFSSI